MHILQISHSTILITILSTSLITILFYDGTGIRFFLLMNRKWKAPFYHSIKNSVRTLSTDHLSVAPQPFTFTSGSLTHSQYPLYLSSLLYLSYLLYLFLVTDSETTFFTWGGGLGSQNPIHKLLYFYCKFLTF